MFKKDKKLMVLVHIFQKVSWLVSPVTYKTATVPFFIFLLAQYFGCQKKKKKKKKKK